MQIEMTFIYSALIWFNFEGGVIAETKASCPC